MSTRSVPFCAELSASLPPVFILFFILLLLVPRPAWAAWPSDPATNVPVCVAEGYQWYLQAAPDATGGAIVAWDDMRDGPRDIYVQRVDATGTPRWTDGGVPLCTATGEQYEPELIPDGSGGAIVVWIDHRGAAYDIYAQRVDSTGAPLWTPNGVAVCSATNFQSHPALIPDGGGGAIITWDDARSGIDRIYAQRVNASGAPQWTPNGVSLTNSPSGQARPVIVSNGAGGAIVVWEDYRNAEFDLFAQRILANGALDPAWPAAGRAIALNWSDQQEPRVAIDGSGGALITWAQWNGGTRNIHVHHVLASGAFDPAWPSGGRVLLSDFYDQSSPAILSDGAGGALVCWDDQLGVGGRDIYAHHVLATGAVDPAWPPSGLAVCPDSAYAMHPRMVSDGAGGAIITWHDLNDAEADIYAQHVMSTGAVDPAWPTDGRAICTAGRRQITPTIVADGEGGAVLAWHDGRNGAKDDNVDIYAQGVKANGQLGEAPVGVPNETGLGLALEPPSPNPNRSGAMLVRFTLPTDAAASLELFDVTGRRVVSREVGSLGAGPHAIDLTADRRPGAGIYFVRLRQGHGARVQRIVLLDQGSQP